MKEALDFMMPAGAESLSFAEFEATIKKVANSINDRPLAVKSSSNTADGEVLPVTPNHLLLGRTSTQINNLVDVDDEDKLTRRTKFVEEVEKEWWKLWYCQVWHTLFPRNKLEDSKRKPKNRRYLLERIRCKPWKEEVCHLQGRRRFPRPGWSRQNCRNLVQT